MKRLILLLTVFVLMLVGFCSAVYLGRARHRALLSSVIGKDQRNVRRVLGEPDRMDGAAEFNRLHKGMLEEGLPLYPKHIAATGPVWHYNTTSTRRLTLFFTRRGRVVRVITTDWPSLPYHPKRAVR